MRKDYTRIKLDPNEVKAVMNNCKNYKELCEKFNCGKDFMRHFLLDNDLYEEYCISHNLPIKLQKHQCCVCGKTETVSSLKGKYYCKKHFNQMYRYGEIQKTVYDDNDFIEQGDITQIILRDKYQNVKAIAIIDTEDKSKVQGYKWYESAGYCITKGINPNNGIDIANVIFDDYEHKYDHANNNRLDNRKVNLRIATSQENAMNMGKKCTNTSGFTGVQQQKQKGVFTGRWTAGITYKYQNIWLGSHKSFDSAVMARLKAEAQYFGEFAPHYNTELKLIDATYVSQDDNLIHHIQIQLDGTILLNEKE